MADGGSDLVHLPGRHVRTHGQAEHAVGEASRPAEMRPWPGRDRRRQPADAVGSGSGSARRSPPSPGLSSARHGDRCARRRGAIPAPPIAARAAGRGRECRRACRRSAPRCGGGARSSHRDGRASRAGRRPAARRAANCSRARDSHTSRGCRSCAAHAGARPASRRRS